MPREPDYEPHFGLAAYVRDLVYECDGREVRGARHFTPGTLVYVAPPHSGDGWERTHVIGPHRDGSGFAAMIGPRSRLHRYHRRWIDDPAALAAISGAGSRSWWVWGDNPEWLEGFSDDPDRETARGGWGAGEWEELGARMLSPERGALVPCVARALDVPLVEAQALIERGDAGWAIRETESGHRHGGASPLRRAREAWEALAPVAWTSDPRRCFLSSRVGEPEERRVPESALAAVCLCADVEGVVTAEELARELAVVCGNDGPVRVAWRVVARSQVHERVQRVAGGRDAPTSAEAVLASVLGAIVGNRRRWREEAGEGLPPGALDALLALVRLGYAFERFSPGRVDLLCPLLPTGR